MFILIGKSFSQETLKTKTYLENNAIHFDYIDLETNKEQAEHYINWLKANKISGLPVLKKDKCYICGCDENRIAAFIKANL